MNELIRLKNYVHNYPYDMWLKHIEWHTKAELLSHLPDDDRRSKYQLLCFTLTLRKLNLITDSNIT